MQKYKKSIPSRLTETWDNLPLRGKYFSINSGVFVSLPEQSTTQLRMFVRDKVGVFGGSRSDPNGTQAKQ